MIVSMTGFARAETTSPAGSLVCELRSVNHRYLETTVRLPEELRALEPEMRAQLQKELRRGKVDCIFTYRSATQSGQALQVDAELLARLTPILDQLVAATRSSAAALQVNLVDLLRFPGVLRESASDPETLQTAGRLLLTAALADLKKMRASEGARLNELVRQRCDQLTGLVAQVRERLPDVQAGIRNRLNERVAELRRASTASAWSRRLRCCCSAWISPRNWTASMGIWKRRARSSRARKRPVGDWIS
jgi:uncharacterized protein (TIGR00255 family)